MLIVDAREPRHLIDELIEKIPGTRVEVLAYGDFMVIGADKRFVIERKQVSDLFKSLNDGRMWQQMKGLERIEGFKKVVLIEGSLEMARKWDKSVSAARFTGTKVSLLYGWDDISLTATESQTETVDFLRRLNEKAGNGQEEQYTRALGFQKERRTEEEELVDVLRGIDGIGDTKAVELLRKFRTIGNVTRASLKELKTVLGDKDSEWVFEVCRRKYPEGKGEKIEAGKGRKGTGAGVA